MCKWLGVNGEDTISNPWRNCPLLVNPGCATGYSDKNDKSSDRLMMISLPPKSDFGVDWPLRKKIISIQWSSSVCASWLNFKIMYYCVNFSVLIAFITLTTFESHIDVVFTLMIPASNMQLSPLKVRCGPSVDGANFWEKTGSSAFCLEITRL